MPLIPVNVSDLPTEYSPLDEGVVYRGLCRSLVINDEPDKNGNAFLKLQAEVLEPDEWRGKRCNDNYIQIPGEVDPMMDGGQRRRALEGGVRYARMARAMGFKGQLDTDEAVGREFSFTVRNEEYQGRTMSKIADYMI